MKGKFLYLDKMYNKLATSLTAMSMIQSSFCHLGRWGGGGGVRSDLLRTGAPDESGGSAV